jgi:epoxyqueuosine reductase
MTTTYAEELTAIGRDAGLDAVGIAPAEPFTGTRRHLEERRAAGLHGGMAFTYRNPARSTDPAATVPGARALVVGAKAYATEPPPRPEGAVGRVARYAWSDHYADLRAALRAVADRLKGDGWRAVVLADDNGLVDREAAYRAGLGWYGKNANLLLPGRGSWFVLGSVVTDAALEPAATPVADGCGVCRRCLDGCPTGAIVAPGVVDARRCLAWLVQQPGPFPLEYRAALGDRIYGCDDCQEVCPPNRMAGRTAAPADSAVEAWVPLVELLAATDDELLARHGRWYIAGRDPRWLRRNALVALGNVGDGSDARVADALATFIAGPDPVLREHAVWAAQRLAESSSPAAASLQPAPTRSARQSVPSRLGGARQSRTPPITPS